MLLLAGHGGTNELAPSGSLFAPVSYGSPGCPGNRNGGKSGGVIFMNVGDHLYLDGLIDANGEDASAGSNAGGGSGGSVWIKCGRFSGHGVITSTGGKGDGSVSGGGSGGRIAVDTPSEIQYLGDYDATGGASGDQSKDTTQYAGGPGTVYLKDTRNQYVHTQLLLDNKYRTWEHYTTLDENRMSYTFDELRLVRKASIHVVPDGRHLNLTFHKVEGDRTGLIHVHANQTLKAEFLDAVYTITRTSANFKLDRDSNAIMATSVHVVGKGDVAFDWNGRLINVQHFYVAYGRKLKIGPYSHTAGIANRRYQFIDKMGTFHFSTLEFGSGSVIHYPPPMGVSFIVSLLVSIACLTKLVLVWYLLTGIK